MLKIELSRLNTEFDKPLLSNYKRNYHIKKEGHFYYSSTESLQANIILKVDVMKQNLL